MSLHKSYIRFSGIDKCWGKKQVLRQAEIEMQGGSCLLITGDNGSGKSTLLRILAGLLKPDNASVCNGIAEKSWHRCKSMIRQHVMYLHQTPYLFDGTVEKNLNYVTSDLCIDEAMQLADICHLAKQNVNGLSGGERQRVALARAWLKQPKVLLLDEPTSNLDSDSKKRTIDLLRKLKARGTSIVIASHDPEHFSHVVTNKLHLQEGRMQSFPEHEYPKDFSAFSFA